jgi:hypothetical protein
LRKDKEKRRAKKEGISYEAEEEAGAAAAGTDAASPKRKAVGSTNMDTSRIRLHLPDGNFLNHTFDSGLLLDDVITFVRGVRCVRGVCAGEVQGRRGG